MSKKDHAQKTTRPISVFILFVGIICFTAVHFIRTCHALAQWLFLNMILSNCLSIYIFFSGMCWFAIGCINAIGLWSGKIWSRNLLIISSLSYTVFYWIDQFFVMENQIRSTNWPFLSITNFILLITLFILLNSKQTKSYIGFQGD